MSNKGAYIIKALIILSILIFFIFLIRSYQGNREASHIGILMDTFVDIRIWGKDSYRALNESWALIENLSKKIDRFNPYSEISKINKNAGNYVEISYDIVDIIKKAKYFAQITNGYFDPTIAPLMRIWGFYDKNYRVPYKKEIEDKLQYVNYRKIHIKGNKVMIEKGMEIDLGGIAKGYLMDKIFEVLRKYSIDRAVLNFGGQVGVYGRTQKGTLWEVSIKHPRKDQGFIGKVCIKEGSVSTSGDYERFFIKDNERYCHIINPKNGYPSNSVISVSVISKSGTEADALSTAFFVLGKDAISLWKEKFSYLGLVIVFPNLNVWYSPNLEFKVESKK
uniref:FAD:protein FMN transferase n=1 Tax=Dictyoglomus thermophilum TaxID=14 RepID=A0A7C3MGZ6_DICTH